VHPVTADAEATPETPIESETDALDTTEVEAAQVDDGAEPVAEGVIDEADAAEANGAPETAVPVEAAEPEAAEPEAAAPEAAAPEAAVPGASEPEAAAPETAESETESVDDGEAVDAEVVATAVPVPVPAAPKPAAPVPSAPKPAAATPAASAEEPWGRVDEDGTVSVREGDSWRVVGQYPDGTAEEALAYFERKYTDLASEVTLLEVRHRRGGASASDIGSAARLVKGKLQDAAAVGDLASLSARVEALVSELAQASESEAAANREAVAQAVAERTELVEKAEALAARDPKTVQWKQASAELTALFDQWQTHQQTGPRLPKATGQALWKRFRDARAIVDKHRREFYAELDGAHKVVRERKTALVEKAEALAPKGEDGIAAYRELLDQWKTAGRAGKKVDDALWARFKAAGDALYGARSEREAADAEASREKIEQRRELLTEAAAVADESDITKARALLTGIQRRWDDIGRIFPRDAERSLDDELRKIEQALRTREETDWKRNNPETKARANDMTRQLTEAIEKLEDELAAATASGDKRAIAKAAEALEARRSWLKALGG
jgi:hypothetical protein